MLTWSDILGMLCVGSLLVVVFGAWISLIVRSRAVLRSRSLAVLRDWAVESGYLILYHDHEPYWSAPFLMVSHAQVAYRIVVEDREGRRRRGWVLIGGRYSGLMTTGRVEAV